jgi:kynurenine formamidase
MCFIDVKPIDLTLTISESIPSFPGSPKPQFISWSNLKEDGYNLELLFLSSHTGTHLDAPYHFVKNGLKINQIPLDRLIGKAILIKIKKN